MTCHYTSWLFGSTVHHQKVFTRDAILVTKKKKPERNKTKAIQYKKERVNGFEKKSEKNPKNECIVSNNTSQRWLRDISMSLEFHCCGNSVVPSLPPHTPLPKVSVSHQGQKLHHLVASLLVRRFSKLKQWEEVCACPALGSVDMTWQPKFSTLLQMKALEKGPGEGW